MSAKLVKDPSVDKALANARAPDKGPEYYVVFRFQGGAGSTLEVAGEGAGGWEEASKLLDSKDAGYVYLRKDHKVELAKTLKFAFVDWFPNGMKVKRRNDVSALKKPVAEVCKPFHVEMSASDLTDVNQKMIDDRIGFVSGTASHVKGKGAASGAAAAPAPAPAAAAAAPAAGDEQAKAAEAPAAAPADAGAAAPAPAVVPPKKAEAKKPAPVVSKPSPKPVAGGGSSGLAFTNKAEFDAAIKAVRDDKSDTNWLVVNYSDKDQLTFVASGSDGYSGMMAKIDDAAIAFALLRVIEVIDGKSKTVKFIFVKYVPETAKPMKRAEVATRSGAVEKTLGQYHVAFDISKKSELSEDIALKKLGQASGSASSVVAKK